MAVLYAYDSHHQSACYDLLIQYGDEDSPIICGLQILWTLNHRCWLEAEIVINVYIHIADYFLIVVEVNKNNFTFQYVIGRGGFGKVWKVELKKEKKLYAMKEMAKARIISKRSVNSVMNEKKFLC